MLSALFIADTAYGNYPMGSLMFERPDSGNTWFIWYGRRIGGDQGTYQLGWNLGIPEPDERHQPSK